jgi:hypothetical protein
VCLGGVQSPKGRIVNLTTAWEELYVFKVSWVQMRAGLSLFCSCSTGVELRALHLLSRTSTGPVLSLEWYPNQKAKVLWQEENHENRTAEDVVG